jgi:hypothetical protein
VTVVTFVVCYDDLLFYGDGDYDLVVVVIVVMLLLLFVVGYC